MSIKQGLLYAVALVVIFGAIAYTLQFVPFPITDGLPGEGAP